MQLEELLLVEMIMETIIKSLLQISTYLLLITPSKLFLLMNVYTNK